MIGIHVTHRRLAELSTKAEQQGGYYTLSIQEQMDIIHCLKVNAILVRRLDELKNLAFIAHENDDLAWEQEICAKIDALEAELI